MRSNPITATIDFEKDGVQHGFMKLPYSRDDSAWGSIMIPITVANNGNGPTALLTGANHGEEYEGPVALMELAHTIDAAQLAGRVIIVPAMNYPAFRAATRTSPIDRGNMNRSFPGRPDGTVTEKIADYFQRTLVPMADVVIDIHAGGKTLDFIPYAAVHRLPDADHEARCVAAMKAFSAPYSMMMLEIDTVGMYDDAVEAMGKIFVTTELGGGGSSTARSNAIAKRGIRNVLVHAGILKGEIKQAPTVMLDMPSDDCFTFAEHDGLFEICTDLAANVKKGDVIAKVWPAERTGANPALYHAKIDGLVTARHFPGLIKMGDCMMVLATNLEASGVVSKGR
ncbi:MAG: N(2)-acetyl-L-2,4-diaminobutanoate deacetylase DoeB [Alphaproteobacteria bacterium]|nr:N(2)-acetyl-L-2,4-diaminobutanoate deacetylase DoeB [Alphaproteobacteria bacterium]